MGRSVQVETSDEKESLEREAEALEVIKQILRDELQLKPGIPMTKEMNFGSLGVDSIVGLQIGEKIGKIFGTLLSPTALFDYPTVGTLADYLVGLVCSGEKKGVKNGGSKQKLLDEVKRKLGEILEVTPKEIENGASFDSLGIDSLLGVGVGEEIGKEFGILISPITLIEYPTVETLAKYLHQSVYSKEKESPEHERIDLGKGANEESFGSPAVLFNSSQMTQNLEPKEMRFFDSHRFLLAGKYWGEEESDIKIVLLHGWLDNAATFDVLAPYLLRALPSVEILSLDLPGHGNSHHYAPDKLYTISDFVPSVLDVVCSMGWDSFHLIGHCMGASVGCLLAGKHPHVVKSFTMFDFPGFNSAPFFNARPNYSHLVDSSIEAVVKRTQSRDPTVPPSNYFSLCKRGLKKSSGGWVLKVDPQLVRCSPSLSTSLRIFEPIPVRVLAIWSNWGSSLHQTFQKESEHLIPSLTCKKIEGVGHYAHLGFPERFVSDLVSLIVKQPAT